MSERIRRTESETFEITIRGLLNKRSDLFAEAEKVQGQLNALRDDIKAVDRILGTLGYQPDPEASMPSAKRLQTPFRHGELGRMIFDTLRTASEPMTTREVAKVTCDRRGEDATDEAFFTNRLQCVSKALRYFQKQGVLVATPHERGRFRWALANKFDG